VDLAPRKIKKKRGWKRVGKKIRAIRKVLIIIPGKGTGNQKQHILVEKDDGGGLGNKGTTQGKIVPVRG